MDTPRVLMLVALGLFLTEGFTLSLFPVQFQQFLAQADPRSLQLAGLVETVLSLCLLAGILWG